MALKKLIAGYYRPINKIVQHEDGSHSHVNGQEWVEQQEVEMHPIEEAEILAHWAVGDSLRDMPQKPDIGQEHEWLLEYGADYVKQKRSEYQRDYQAWQIKHQPLVDAHRKAADKYEAWANKQAELAK